MNPPYYWYHTKDTSAIISMMAVDTLEISAAQVRRRISRAYFELMAIVVADVESAHGFTMRRHPPSPASLAVYDDVVLALEAQADAQTALR